MYFTKRLVEISPSPTQDESVTCAEGSLPIDDFGARGLVVHVPELGARARAFLHLDREALLRQGGHHGRRAGHARFFWPGLLRDSYDGGQPFRENECIRLKSTVFFLTNSELRVRDAFDLLDLFGLLRSIAAQI